MRLFLRHVAPSLVGTEQPSRSMTTHREPGWELQHQGTHDPYDMEDGSSERKIFPAKSSES